MRIDCEQAREEIDAWAIGALDEHDARALEAHISACDACTAQARLAQEAAAALSFGVPLVAAGAALKSRVMASAAVLSDIGRADRPRQPRAWAAAVAALAAVGIGAFTWGGLLQHRVDGLQGTNARIARDATASSVQLADLRTQVVSASNVQSTLETQDAVIDVVLQPDMQRTELAATGAAPGATGHCLWSQAKALGAFVATNLPLVAAGLSYHMWIVYDRKWISAGSFTVDASGRGQLVMHKRWDDAGDIGAFLGFAVTIESTPTPIAHSDALVLRSQT